MPNAGKLQLPRVTITAMRNLTLSLLFLWGISAVRAQTPPPANSALPFSLKNLGHGAYAAIDNAKGEAGANAGFVIGDDGVAVIDSFDNEPAAPALLGEIRVLTQLPAAGGDRNST